MPMKPTPTQIEAAARSLWDRLSPDFTFDEARSLNHSQYVWVMGDAEAALSAALSVPAAVVGEPIQHVRAHAHLIRCFADEMTDRNWADKALYIKQQAERIMSEIDAAPSAPDGLDRVATLEHLLGEVLHCHNDGTGLLDSMDNKGGRYTSKHLADTIEAIRAALGEKP